MFLLIHGHKWKELICIGMRMSSEADFSDEALLALDYAFTFLLSEADSPFGPIMLTESPILLLAFRTYTALLKVCMGDVRENRALGVLSGPSGRSNSYILLDQTFLHKTARSRSRTEISAATTEDGSVITARLLSEILVDTLGNRMRTRTSIICNACKHLQVVRPCVSYCLSGRCSFLFDDSCSWFHYGGPHPLDTQGFHLRIHLYCRTILILDNVDAHESVNEAVWMERYAHPMYI